MAIAQMSKIRLVVHEQAVAAVLGVVQRHGVVEFTPVTDQRVQVGQAESFDLHRNAARLDFAVDFLADFAPSRGGLRAMVEGNAEIVTEDDLTAKRATTYTADVIDAAHDIQKQLNDLDKEVGNLRKEQADLTPWKKVALTVGSSATTKQTQTLWLVQSQRISEKKPHKTLYNELRKLGTVTVLLPIDEKRLLLTIMQDEQDTINEALKTVGYDAVSLEARRGAPAEELVRIDKRLVKIATIGEVLRTKATQLATEYLSDLKVASDTMMWKRERSDVAGGCAATTATKVFEGWCPTAQIEALRGAIIEQTTDFALDETTPNKGEVAPVEIVNNGFVRPFEAVTRLYGMPGNDDIDPTPYLAGFFFVFFGFCLTDVGYGAILAGLTGFVLWRYTVPASTKTLLQLLFLGGVSSFLMGLLFGGYFGIDMSKMPQFLQAIAQFDPLQNPIPVFYFALALGVVHVMFGMVLHIVRAAKNGDLIGGILDKAAWLAIFVSLGIWGAEKAGAISTTWTVWLVYASLAALILTQGHREKSIGAKLGKGIFSLYDSIAYFSDILSYSRLLALGLATSALAFAVNLIAQIIGDMIPYVGGVVAIIILIGGHIFNLVVNALGAFIHSARLQFVEFFGKFIYGTGRPFRPFSRTQRNIIIQQKR